MLASALCGAEKMKQRITKRNRLTYTFPPQLEELLKLVQLFLIQQMKPKVFCRTCRAEVPDMQDYCARCEQRRRIYELVSPQVKTVGGSVKFWSATDGEGQ